MNERTPRQTWPPKNGRLGLLCPRCGCADLPVLNTRYQSGRIKRYRQCRYCGRRVITYEVTPAHVAETASEDGP